MSINIGPAIDAASSNVGEQLVIPQRLERLPVTSYQTTIGLVICFSWFLDDLDLGGMTFMLSTLAKEFHLNAIQMGYLGSMSFAGMLLGTLFTGLYADKIGRRTILLWAMCLWGVAGLLCAISWNIESLFCFRFLLGMGLGMELPAAHAMLPEFFPTKSRGRWVAFMEGLLPVGIIAAGFIAYFLLPIFGWRWVFVVEALPAVWLVFVRERCPIHRAGWKRSAGEKKRTGSWDRLSVKWKRDMANRCRPFTTSSWWRRAPAVFVLPNFGRDLTPHGRLCFGFCGRPCYSATTD